MAKVIWELRIDGETVMCFERKKDVPSFVESYKKEHNLDKIHGTLIRWFPYNKPSCIVWRPKD